MDAFHLPFGGLKVSWNGDLAWLDWQEADVGVGQNLLDQLPAPERDRIEAEWRLLLETIEAAIQRRLDNEKD